MSSVFETVTIKAELFDSDCEETTAFVPIEIENTFKCLENLRLIIKDFETQLDWHLQQYIALRAIPLNFKNPNKEIANSHDTLTISHLNAVIATYPEGNKNFIKRKLFRTRGRLRRKKMSNDLPEVKQEFDKEEQKIVEPKIEIKNEEY